MKDTFLKIAGVKSEKDFYKKYPSEEAFFTAHPEAMQMKQGGAVDLNAFYNQPRFIQTNIMKNGGAHYDDSRDAWVAADGTIGPNGPYNFALGGAMLPEFQFAGQYMNKNPFFSDSDAYTQPSEVRTPGQRTSFMNNLNSSFSVTPAAAVTNTDAATVANTGAAVGASAGAKAVTTPVSQPTGNSQLRGADGKLLSAQQTIYARPLANHQVLGNKSYKFASDASLMPFMGTGMLDNDGLSGYLKAGLGMMSGVGGMMTGLDNVWRGFKGRKEDAPGAANTPTNYQSPMMQESPLQEMQRKKQQQINPSMFPPGMNFAPNPAVDMNNTAAYGGELYKAADGFNYSLNPNVDPTKISIGKTQMSVDPLGLQRTLGANAGLGMFNEVVGMGQAKKQNRMAQVQQGMSDFAYQPDDSNSMAMGYDTLNTGPGQTQAPNLYTPVQYAGQQMVSQYEEGGEYDWTPEQIHQFLAEGGEIEFV